MTYDIVTYCSDDYIDAYEFVIESWLKNTHASRIYIYTDSGRLKSNDNRVIIKKEFSPSNQWIVNTGRRIDAIEKYISDVQDKSQYFVLLDIDCFIISPFDELFDIMDKHFDLTLTRLAGRNEHSRGTATAGVFFAKNNDKIKLFMEDWRNLANRYLQEGKGTEKHKVSYAQYSFTKVVTDAFDGRKSYKVYIASESIYNFESQNDTEWAVEIQKYPTKIIHFKGRRWRNLKLVSDIFQVIKDGKVRK